jgi:uncharacterized protein (UPF0335 family)
MSEAAAGVGHNTIAGAELKRFVERIERIEEEVKALNADKSEVYQELKARGYAAPTVRQIVKLRRMDKAEREEKAFLLDLYMNALGMLADTPLGEAARRREFDDTRVTITGAGQTVETTAGALRRAADQVDLEEAIAAKQPKQPTTAVKMPKKPLTPVERAEARQKFENALARGDKLPPYPLPDDEPPPATADPVGAAVVEMPPAPDMPAAAE